MTEGLQDGLAIDADGHVHESEAMFSEHLAPEMRAERGP